ncbi:hypothetical protein MOUN0_A02784 [Monosporozyma unispora]|nr:hypothetical protein C6P44_003845 [Kazachstania unispora]
MNSKIAFLLSAVAASAQAYNVSPDQVKQLEIIMGDVKSNLFSYMALVVNPTSGITFSNLPDGLVDIGANMAMNANYKPDYSKVDIEAVSTFITKLSWFSNKLEPELASAGVPMVGGKTTTTLKGAVTSLI